MSEQAIIYTPSTAMYLPGNTDIDDDDEDDDTYYSIIPDRSQAVRERWKYAFRRTCFYVFLGTVFGGTIAYPFIITNLTIWFWIIYFLWFELDVTERKNAVSITSSLPMHFTPSIIFSLSYYRFSCKLCMVWHSMDLF
jgi:hypothetical protein